MTPIWMRVYSQRICRLSGEERWVIVKFLKKLRGHYRFLNIQTMPAIEFLIGLYERYPNVTEGDFYKGRNAANQIYDGFEMQRPSETAAITAALVAEEKARLNREAVKMALTA